MKFISFHLNEMKFHFIHEWSELFIISFHLNEFKVKNLFHFILYNQLK